MKKPRKQVAPARKMLYYLGMLLMGIGVFLFLSTFVAGLRDFGDFGGNLAGRARDEGARAFTGLGLCAIGGIMMTLGARGLAGSGVILDPEKARRDLEPWSRMGGGMLQDALSEIEPSSVVGRASGKQVKVRCQACKALNDENSKFCNQCGAGV